MQSIQEHNSVVKKLLDTPGKTYQERAEDAFGKVSFQMAVALLTKNKPFNHAQMEVLSSSTTRNPPEPVGFFRFIKIGADSSGCGRIIAVANHPEVARKVNSIARTRWTNWVHDRVPGITRKQAMDIWCRLRGQPNYLDKVTVEILELYYSRFVNNVRVKPIEVRDLGLLTHNPAHRNIIHALNEAFGMI